MSATPTFNLTWAEARWLAIAGSPVRHETATQWVAFIKGLWWLLDRSLNPVEVITATDFTSADYLVNDWTTDPIGTVRDVCAIPPPRHGGGGGTIFNAPFIPPPLSLSIGDNSLTALLGSSRPAGNYQLHFFVNGTSVGFSEASSGATTIATTLPYGTINARVIATSRLPLPLWTATATDAVIIDPDAQSYFDAILANGGTIGTSAQTSVNSFISGLKNDGLWDLIHEMGLFCGVDQLAAAMVKIKTPLTSRLLTNVNISSGDFISTGPYGGLKGNGINKYLNSGFVSPATDSDFGIWAYYKGTESIGSSRAVIQAQSSTGWSALGWLNTGASETGTIGSTYAKEYPQGSPTSTFGFCGVTVNGSRSNQWYLNGDPVGTSKVTTGPIPTVPFYILCNNNNGTASSFSTRYVRGYAFTRGLSSSQAAAFASRWNALMTSFGANTY